MTLFHSNIHFLRKLRKLSQSDAGELFEMSQDTWSKWEKGREPEYEILVKMSDYFNVSIDDLIRVDMSKEGVPAKESDGLKKGERTKLLAVIGEKDVELRDKDKTVREFKSLVEFILSLDTIKEAKGEVLERIRGVQERLAKIGRRNG